MSDKGQNGPKDDPIITNQSSLRGQSEGTEKMKLNEQMIKKIKSGEKKRSKGGRRSVK